MPKKAKQEKALQTAPPSDSSVPRAGAGEISAEVMEKAVIRGDLSDLTVVERTDYYLGLCHRLKVDPLTQPFRYLELQGRLVLYATKDCAAQLRRVHGISVTSLEREVVDDVLVITASGTDSHGRTDMAIGAVPLTKEKVNWKTKSGKRVKERTGKFIPLTGEDAANALMKGETKAKRRLTLSLAGLGFLDETEAESVVASGGARMVEPDPQSDEAMIEAEPSGPNVAEPVIDSETGEIVNPSGEPIPSISDANDFWVELEAQYGVKPGDPKVKGYLADRAEAEKDHPQVEGYWQRSWNHVAGLIQLSRGGGA